MRIIIGLLLIAVLGCSESAGKLNDVELDFLAKRDSNKPTKLPKKFIKPKTRLLSDLKIGEECYLEAYYLKVHKDRTLWLNPDTRIRLKPYDTYLWHQIKVRRTKRGYEVKLLKSVCEKLYGYKFKLEPSKYSLENFIPVIKFSIERE